ncbi:MAG: class I SAM-dependent methyltransferase [Ignavibacteriales bacterium]|nr:class I SAM-dependent methyltransferase [Ignavibacteriales bacterium]
MEISPMQASYQIMTGKSYDQTSVGGIEEEESVMDVVEQKQRVRKFFDSSDFWQGKVYRDPADRFARAVVRRKLYALEMIRTLPIYRGARVLDVGSGSGVYAAELVKNGFMTFAMDISEASLKCSRDEIGPARNYDRVKFLCADVESLPVKNETFDLVLCIGVLGYLLKYQSAITELHRVLKPRGYLLVNVENLLSLSSIDYFYRKRLGSLVSSGTNGARDNGSSTAMESPWVRDHSPTGYRYYLYHPWKFERDMHQKGFRLIDGMTFGYPFRLLRKWKFVSETTLDRVELLLEKVFRVVRVPYFSYSGETYTAVFQKN